MNTSLEVMLLPPREREQTRTFHRAVSCLCATVHTAASCNYCSWYQPHILCVWLYINFLIKHNFKKIIKIFFQNKTSIISTTITVKVLKICKIMFLQNFQKLKILNKRIKVPNIFNDYIQQSNIYLKNNQSNKLQLFKQCLMNKHIPKYPTIHQFFFFKEEPYLMTRIGNTSIPALQSWKGKEWKKRAG